MDLGKARLWQLAIGLATLLTASAIAAGSAATPRNAPDAKNLIVNGSFARGAGNVPDQWRTEAWDQKPDASTYHWSRTSNGAGEIEIDNLKPNDARFTQEVVLSAGWYYVSAEIRTEGVAPGIAGATISVLEDSIISPSLNGTQPWTKAGFYLKIGSRGSNVAFACRLGGYSAMNKGRAFFRDARVERIAMLPPGAQPAYDLDAIRKSLAPKPLGTLWTFFATLLILGAAAYAGWRSFVLPPPERSRARPRTSRRRQ